MSLQSQFYQAPHIEQASFFEFVIQETIKEFSESGSALIDAGAAGGSHAGTMARTVGPGGHVHAFEPNPNLATWVERLRETYPWIEVHRMAFSDRTGERPFNLAIEGGMGRFQSVRTWNGSATT